LTVIRAVDSDLCVRFVLSSLLSYEVNKPPVERATHILWELVGNVRLLSAFVATEDYVPGVWPCDL
jgi:hypothetical protein